MKSLLVISLISLSFPAFASQRVNATRFENQIKILDDLFSQYHDGKKPFKTISRDVNHGLHRVATFNLQALGSIFQKYDAPSSMEFFKDTIRFEAKALEDAIGGIDKWEANLEEALKFAEKTTKNKKQAKKKVREAHKELDLAKKVLDLVLSGDETEIRELEKEWTEDIHKFMHKWDEGKPRSAYRSLSWVKSQPQIAEQMRRDIRKYQWLDYKEDRDYVLKRLVKHLENLEETEFNFSLLEDTPTEKGLHEFRREVRWFSFKAQSLNGTIAFKDSLYKDWSCPIQSISDLVNKHKHPKLHSSPYNKLYPSKFPEEKAHVCGISRCLHYHLNSVVTRVGSIKDGVETGNHIKGGGNKTPNYAVKATQVIYEELKSTGTALELIKEIKACL